MKMYVDLHKQGHRNPVKMNLKQQVSGVEVQKFYYNKI